MVWGPILLGIWPGLARLWIRGEFASLALAIGFSMLLNLTLVSTFYWPELMGTGFARFAWPLLGIVWIASAANTWVLRHELFFSDTKSVELDGEIDQSVVDRLFLEAQTEYLKGDWERTERLLQRQLDRYPRDAASRLLLATMLRRCGRWDEATRELDCLLRIDQSEPWQFEISREREFIRLALAQNSDEYSHMVNEQVDSTDREPEVVRELHPVSEEDRSRRAA